MWLTALLLVQQPLPSCFRTLTLVTHHHVCCSGKCCSLLVCGHILIAGPQIWKCAHCQAEFTKKGIKEYHVETCAPTVILPFQNGSITLHRDPTTKTFLCKCSAPTCPQAFASCKIIRQHVKAAKSSWPKEDQVLVLSLILIQSC